MSKEQAVEAALNQYSLLLNGKVKEHWEQDDQDGMREELYALVELMAPYLREEALRDAADKEQAIADNEPNITLKSVHRVSADRMYFYADQEKCDQ